MDCAISEMRAEHWPQVAEIFRQGIDTMLATFADTVPTWEEWNAEHAKDCRLVATCGGQVVGWFALTPTSKKPSYSGSAEASLYVHDDWRGKGIGKRLLKEAIRLSEKLGYWTLAAYITKENETSIAMCAKYGFRTLGVRERPGRTPDGKWHDVVIMERRSKTVGC